MKFNMVCAEHMRAIDEDEAVFDYETTDEQRAQAMLASPGTGGLRALIQSVAARYQRLIPDQKILTIYFVALSSSLLVIAFFVVLVLSNGPSAPDRVGTSTASRTLARIHRNELREYEGQVPFNLRSWGS
ncbi:MAG: hypothetical protein O3A76_14930 [Chloroflexi bacterium]|nr:hypothetical protein [Chloroflexota bacterium]